jgi:5-carboxymethyl-2-hydroxymuconate isomerase
MPHFIIDCSEDILKQKSPEEIMWAVYNAAESTGLFSEDDIKVRINPFHHFMLAKSKRDFIHVFGNIMEGRTTEQKADLSKKVIEALNRLFPKISVLSMNVSEFEKATYSNKALIDPLNKNNDRHFKG